MMMMIPRTRVSPDYTLLFSGTWPTASGTGPYSSALSVSAPQSPRTIPEFSLGLFSQIARVIQELTGRGGAEKSRFSSRTFFETWAAIFHSHLADDAHDSPSSETFRSE
jgi:hypothetical protein